MSGRHPPAYPSRRQSEWHQQAYAQSQHQQIPPHYYPHHANHQYYMPQYPPQYHTQPWYPQQYAVPQNHQQTRYPQHQQPQPTPSQHYPYSPVIVASNPHLQSPVLNRHMAATPPNAHSHHSPVPAVPPHMAAAIPTPPTPSTSSQAPASPQTPTTATTATTPPLAPAETPVSTPPKDAATPRRHLATANEDHATHERAMGPASVTFGDRSPEIIARRQESQFPWQSHTDADFPKRIKKKLRKQAAGVESSPVAFPDIDTRDGRQDAALHNIVPASLASPESSAIPEVEKSSEALPSVAPNNQTSGRTEDAPKVNRASKIPAIPLIPVRSAAQASVKAVESSNATDAPLSSVPESSAAIVDTDPATQPDAEQKENVASPSSKPVTSWAQLARRGVNGAAAAPATSQNGAALPNGVGGSKFSMTDVLQAFNADSESRIQFLEPRGLVNTGNMCYMNSILQTLVFCTPFYDLLNEIKRRVTLNLAAGSKTSLVEAMIDFMGEFTSITSADSVEQLKLRLKEADYQTYGAPFTPDALYDVIRASPRFSHMRRGHQQDAEEFLNHLFEGLHEEFALAITKTKGNTESHGGDEDEWSEVGRKQKAAVTHSSGDMDLETPVTKIFGGKQRSVLRKAGAKDSVTFERFQHLALHIASPDVNNIIDALKHLSLPENVSLDGGPKQVKQTFMEVLPPVLILHLKRFGYDTVGGAQKIWKKVGYPLELEIPKEVFPPTKRNSMASFGGFPRYRLIGVVYHHGKNASGGHYTVDVRRQDREEWIRIDDTYINRVPARVVADGGSEEDPKVLAAALEQHKRDQSRNRNIYEIAGLDDEKEQAEEGIWKEKAAGSKKWTGVVNGTATPSSTGKQTPRERAGFKDNKVAYVLMYQRIRS